MFEMYVIMLLMFRCVRIGVRFISRLCYVNNSIACNFYNVTATQELLKVIGLMGLGRNKRDLDLGPT